MELHCPTFFFYFRCAQWQVHPRLGFNSRPKALPPVVYSRAHKPLPWELGLQALFKSSAELLSDSWERSSPLVRKPTSNGRTFFPPPLARFYSTRRLEEMRLAVWRWFVKFNYFHLGHCVKFVDRMHCTKFNMIGVSRGSHRRSCQPSAE